MIAENVIAIGGGPDRRHFHPASRVTAEAVATRVRDCEAKVLDHGGRFPAPGKVVPMKEEADRRRSVSQREKVVVVRRWAGTSRGIRRGTWTVAI